MGMLRELGVLVCFCGSETSWVQRMDKFWIYGEEILSEIRGAGERRHVPGSMCQLLPLCWEDLDTHTN